MSRKLINSVAVTVKNIRKSAGISQEELAAKAGLDRTYISGIERGVRNITLESLEQVVNALQVPLPHFLIELKSNLKDH